MWGINLHIMTLERSCAYKDSLSCTRVTDERIPAGSRAGHTHEGAAEEDRSFHRRGCEFDGLRLSCIAML